MFPIALDAQNARPPEVDAVDALSALSSPHPLGWVVEKM